VGLVGKGSDDRVVHGIPYSRYEHKCSHRAHSDAKHVGVENHEEVAYEHPTEVAAYIAHSIGNLADERHTAIVFGSIHILLGFCYFSDAKLMLSRKIQNKKICYFLRNRSRNRSRFAQPFPKCIFVFVYKYERGTLNLNLQLSSFKKNKSFY